MILPNQIIDGVEYEAVQVSSKSCNGCVFDSKGRQGWAMSGCLEANCVGGDGEKEVHFILKRVSA